MCSERVAIICDRGVGSTVLVNQCVGIGDRADLVTDRLVDEQRHLRDTMITHLAVAVDDGHDKRVEEDADASNEIVIDVLEGERGRGLVERQVLDGQEFVLVVLPDSLELAEEECLGIGELADETYDTRRDETCTVCLGDSVEDVEDVGRQATHSGTSDGELRGVCALKLGCPLACKRSAGVSP